MNIVIFCDGTWNSPEEEEFGLPVATNVYKLFRACMDRAESAGQQTVWYQQGVGSTGGRVRRMVEGSTGTGIRANVKRGYAAIAANYTGPNDRIFLVGFSRGAFTARSIAGMIETVGLVKEATRVVVDSAYAAYSRSRHHDSAEAEKHRASEHVRSDVRVHAIGVWETVGALGISFWGASFNLRRIFRNRFHVLSPSRITDNFIHALGIDEKRTSFMPTLWEQRDGGTARTRIVESWFRGVHSDIGGGYGDCDLSDETLRWMAGQLRRLGLMLRDGAPKCAPDHNGRIHNSVRGPIWSNVASWPRPTPLRALGETGADPEHHLHESVLLRERDAGLDGRNERARRFLEVGEAVRVEIRAQVLWEYTGIVLKAGQVFELRDAGGVWQDDGETPVTAEGQPEDDESRIKRLARWSRRKPDAPYMALIAVPNVPVPAPERDLGLLEAIRFKLLPAPPAYLGLMIAVNAGGTTLEPETDAMLWCFANDLWRHYSNNTGSVVLEILRSR